MASWSRRLTCLAVATVLSGSPAVLSACMALCVDGPVARASAPEGTPAGHHQHGVASAPMASSSHARHAPSTPGAPDAGVTSALPPSAARLSSTCDSCCDAGPDAIVAGLVAGRTAAQAVATAPTPAAVPFHIGASTSVGPPPSPPVPPPSPTRAPLALRI
ncbi:MAG: hypothetical protein AB7L91_02225 [Dehalococcoidia bacterium]